MSFHEFRAAPVDTSKCLFCNLAESEHICSVCNKSDVKLNKMAGMLYCEPCLAREELAQKELEASAKTRVAELETNRVPSPDTTIEVITDIFNAQIASIEEWRKEIELDTTIINKHFELAQRMEARYLHLKSVITDAQNTLKTAQNDSRSIQTYYNDLAKRLKSEERERIRIADVQYHPPEKPTKATKAPSVKKYNKIEIREASGISGIPEQILTMLCVTHNVSVKEAIQMFRQITSKE